MSDFERPQRSILLERLEEQPQRIIFVTGPRQTGKTTLVENRTFPVREIAAGVLGFVKK